MNTISDVLVVGAGPCGSFTAMHLAKLGKSVTVFEEHNQIGIPTHCAGHLSIIGLKQLGLYSLPPDIIQNSFKGANFYSPNGNKFTVHFNRPITCTVDRAKFDRYIAEKAQNAGAEYHLNSHVEALTLNNGTTEGVIVRQQTEEHNHARIVVDAEGILSKLSRQAGLPAPQRIVKAVEAEVENLHDTESDSVDVYLGNSYAPGFYAWLIPKKDGKAKVGLAAKTGNPKELLERLIRKQPAASRKLRSAKILSSTFHSITLGGPATHPYSNGFLAIGDAASQVKPTTGGGVIMGLTCAQAAAKVASEALDNNDSSSQFLKKYGNLCRKLLSFDMKIMLGMRSTLDSMSDQRLNYAIALCTKLGLDKTLQNVEDIDFQGKTLVHALRNPRIMVAVSYFLYAFLSANL